MKVALFLNITKPGVFEFARQVIDKLSICGAEVWLPKSYEPDLAGARAMFGAEIDDIVASCDVVLAIGGDGTVIRFAKHAAKFEKPILGINFGRVGFVAGLERDELDKLELLVVGKYGIQKRSLLEVKVHTNGDVETFWAFNDAVVYKGESAKVVDFSVCFKENEVCSYCADGVILATSTGSTAYSLSAGGPIVDPELDCILLTPVCAHAMFSRSIVFSGDDFVTIKASTREGSAVFLSIDGNNVMNLDESDVVKVRSMPKKVSMVTFGNKSFYKRLQEKLLDKFN